MAGLPSGACDQLLKEVSKYGTNDSDETEAILNVEDVLGVFEVPPDVSHPGEVPEIAANAMACDLSLLISQRCVEMQCYCSKTNFTIEASYDST